MLGERFKSPLAPFTKNLRFKNTTGSARMNWVSPIPAGFFMGSSSGVARFFNGFRHRRRHAHRIRRIRQTTDQCTFQKVHRGVRHTVRAAGRFFHAGRTRGATHAGDVKSKFFHRNYAIPPATSVAGGIAFSFKSCVKKVRRFSNSRSFLQLTPAESFCPASVRTSNEPELRRPKTKAS